MSRNYGFGHDKLDHQPKDVLITIRIKINYKKSRALVTGYKLCHCHKANVIADAILLLFNLS